MAPGGTSEQSASPPPDLRSLDEMLAVALAMEREATTRYAALADCMRRVDQPRIAALLDELATEERTHMDAVERLAQRTLHHGPDPTLVHGPLPKTFARDDEATAATLLSPYRTLSLAVRHEERAFAFWTYVAARSDKPQLNDLAETLARQELLHAAKLRHARRRAFHAERDGRRLTRRDDDATAISAVRIEAARLEGAFAAFCAAAGQQLRSGGDIVSADLFQRLGDEAQQAAVGWSRAESDAAPELDRQAAIRRSQLHGAKAAALLFEAAGMIEDLDYRYLEWLDAAPDQESVKDLEARARAATARLARVNHRLRDLEPSVAAIVEADSER